MGARRKRRAIFISSLFPGGYGRLVFAQWPGFISIMTGGPLNLTSMFFDQPGTRRQRANDLGLS